MNKLRGQTILVTGGAVRIGRALSLALAQEGADLVIQFNSSKDEAEQIQAEIADSGGSAEIFQVDFSSPEACQDFSRRIFSDFQITALVNNAAIFSDLDWEDTSISDWDLHLAINLTAPFLLSKEFALSLSEGSQGRIVNLLDWRALRPGSDHLPYTISKAGLAALTRSMAISLAPAITVNGLALGAILPPSNGGKAEGLVVDLPQPRWAEQGEVEAALLFLLTGPTYITGEIIHVDGGRHLI